MCWGVVGLGSQSAGKAGASVQGMGEARRTGGLQPFAHSERV